MMSRGIRRLSVSAICAAKNSQTILEMLTTRTRGRCTDFPANSQDSEVYNGARTVEGIVAFIDGKIGTKGKVKQPPPAAVKQ